MASLADPLPVRSITYDLKKQQSGILTISWNHPGGYVNYYVVTCTPLDGESTPYCPFIKSVSAGTLLTLICLLKVQMACLFPHTAICWDDWFCHKMFQWKTTVSNQLFCSWCCFPSTGKCFQLSCAYTAVYRALWSWEKISFLRPILFVPLIFVNTNSFLVITSKVPRVIPYSHALQDI